MCDECQQLKTVAVYRLSRDVTNLQRSFILLRRNANVNS